LKRKDNSWHCVHTLSNKETKSKLYLEPLFPQHGVKRFKQFVPSLQLPGPLCQARHAQSVRKQAAGAHCKERHEARHLVEIDPKEKPKEKKEDTDR